MSAVVTFTRLIGETKRAECIEQPPAIERLSAQLRARGCDLTVELLSASNDVILTVIDAQGTILADACCPNSEVVPVQVADLILRAARAAGLLPDLESGSRETNATPDKPPSPGAAS